MTDLNKVMLIGRIGAKPELRKTQGGDAVCRMRVATSHGVRQEGQSERETLWHSVVAFDRLAELCAEHLDKGRLVYVEGALRATSWRDKEGVVHDTREVRAHNISFLGAHGKVSTPGGGGLRAGLPLGAGQGSPLAPRPAGSDGQAWVH